MRPLQAPRYRRIWIYTKCNAPVGTALRQLPNVEWTRAPNVGSNDYAALQHILHRYEELAPLTLFCEGGEHEKCSPYNVLRPGMEHALSRDVMGREGMGREGMGREGADFGAGSGTGPGGATQRSRTSFGSQLLYPWVFRNSWPVGGFSMLPMARASTGGASNATGTGGYTFFSTNRSFPLVLSGYTNLSSWLAHTIGAAASALILERGERICFEGFLAAEATNLHRYPRALYAAIAKQQVAPNEEVDHFMERLWGLLLTAPVTPRHADYHFPRAPHRSRTARGLP